ncbi:TetR/AcrR family transcriptional regulator [Sedimentibacter sp. MB31-C6]|uniref:TetR/AcrR family transcriptional regulator n=1 Tax=Sedimentibacter sp. MB31-C6 TaxID=3109366 RepID=UPI002DDD90DC|nr:TetR/AcrR family transcriptional regulator [Sedimentibacter sp. MB36-C1]WSI05074.1 TetR/AcrR family transcriptional regulator [Sedimentibacter sp. MB36-C1]
MLDKSKKERILIASLEEFSEHGFEKASTDSISIKADVSKGLIFHYFGTKEKLYMTTINECVDDILDDLLFNYNKIDLQDTDLITILMKLMENKYNFFIKNPLHYKLVIKSFYNSPPKLKSELDKRYSELKEIGYNIMAEIIKNLSLKRDIDVNNVISIITAITNIIELKFTPYLTDDTANFKMYYEEMKEEYIKLMKIVMYGILNEQKDG